MNGTIQVEASVLVILKIPFERPCIKDTTYIKCNNAPLGRRWLLNIQRGSYCPPVVAEYHNGLN